MRFYVKEKSASLLFYQYIILYFVLGSTKTKYMKKYTI